MDKFPENNWRGLYQLALLHFISIKILNKEFKRLKTKHGKKLGGYYLIIYYHALRSVELLLKSFLIFKGQTRAQIKKEFKHDIEFLLLEVDTYGVTFDAKAFMTLVHLNKYYQEKEFEYASLRSLRLLPIEKMVDLIKSMFIVIEKEIKVKKTRQIQNHN